MEKYYSSEKNVQILVSLMKAHKIRKIVASPGTTNICLVQSLQCDSYFEIYSAADERSAAYIACGLAEESKEPVVLSCTGATASRNYIPGLTEAYYRKLPILAVTATQHTGRIGQNIAQVIDRTNPLNDIAKLSIQIPTIHDAEDKWAYTVAMNKALLELRRHGGGPVHINLTTTYSDDFSIKTLPEVQVIRRVCMKDAFPAVKADRVGIIVGAHAKWSERLTSWADEFCEKYNAVVFCDNTSNYKGKYGIHANLITSQEQYHSPCKNMDLLIHIGNVSGAYMSVGQKQTWRVNPDGEVRDTFYKLSHVFEMEEADFFEYYVKIAGTKERQNSYIREAEEEYARLYHKIPELPFSNIWLAKQTAHRIPEDSIIHFGILNSLRAWNFFKIPDSVYGYSNTGGFGIDGCVSSLLGASLANLEQLHFGVVGDLAFFYDMNVLGNRHFANNIRLIVVNNGCGTEFKNYNHKAAKFGADADAYMAAVGHYGRKSPELLKHYATDLGFVYISANSKEEYLGHLEYFLSPKMYDRPVIFEVFTDSKEESDALSIINNLEISAAGTAKKLARNILGDKGIKAVKNFIAK
uniref:thiamine pyrophosphate-binding protein n=1 Tax=Agathobacter sp. TaxID=2021311 RepID=UPI004056E852